VILAPDRALVAVVLDRMMPGGDGGWPSATEAGLLDEFDALYASDHAEAWADVFTPGFAALRAESEARHGSGFAELAPTEQDALLASLERGETETGWPVSPAGFIARLARLIAFTAYARRGGPYWHMIGYDAGPKRDAGAGMGHVRPDSSPFADLPASVDVLVIGAGAGGGVAACVAAEAGATVLLVDRGRNLAYGDVPRDHLRNHRFPVHGHGTGPDSAPGVGGEPRLYRDAAGRERVVSRPHEPAWFNNAMTVGGGTRVYQGMAWRFLPDDFRLATRYGVPAGSTLADWPVTYGELEIYYARAEWELGVCGDGSAHRSQGFRSRGYPMVPLPPNPEADLLQRGAERLGWSTGPVPLLINSEPRGGRGRCVQCGECVGFPCPSDAKNGTSNTLIPRALATGRCRLVPSCQAVAVTTGADGQVTGAELLDLASGARALVKARHVVVAAGAIETARLLLLSRSDAHPDGIGNATDQVGRNLQGHLYAGAFGLFDEPVHDMRGPGASIGTCDFNHGDGLGGVLHNECIKLPALFWWWALPPDLRRWGEANTRHMRDFYLRTAHVQGPIQEVPFADSRVTLANEVRDRWGLPVAHLTGPLHPESLRAAERHRERALAWIEAAGARRAWHTPLSPELSAGQHQAGTCRMGADPATSVTDPVGRVHGHDNLWVMDASLHVTNGGFNPVLTVFALAFRAAERLAAS